MAPQGTYGEHSVAPPSSSLVPAGVPKGGPSLLLLMAVGGGALFLGAIIVIVMLAR